MSPSTSAGGPPATPRSHPFAAGAAGAAAADVATTLPELLARQAAATPDAVAVSGDGGRLTYRRLLARGRRLAARLRRRGVGPEVQVGLAMERGVDAVVALVAIVEAGGAYVPLDPGYPAERLAYMAEVTGCRLLVADRASLDRLPPLAELGLGADSVLVPAEAEEDVAEEAPAPPALSPDHLAYVNFTSGSTGRPKGVAVPHRAVVRLVEGMSYAPVGPGDTVMQLAPLSFDAATFEVWGALARGATLAIFPAGPVSPRALARWLPAAGVTTAWLTAGLFHQVVDAHPEALAGVDRLLAGGDVLSAPHVRRALEVVGGGEGVVVDGYGPTESTTFTTCHPMRRGDLDGATSVPVGRPIHRTRVSLLSPALEVLEGGGAEGHLAIGGDGLARGYLGRPAATAEVFVPDPAAGRPGGGGTGARLYLSGDRARRRDDGAYDFLGRLDDQVKVRGFRVEPGEIESVLAEHPAVAAAVVLAEPDPAGGRRLVAFVARAGDGADGSSLEELRGYLAGRLPAFMVPAAFEVVAELPLGPTGKVDRKALAAGRGAACAGATARPDLATPYVAPRGELERTVAAVWTELMGLDRVGVDDDLYELGGHSLLATRILARLREVTGVEVPLPVIFERPTVAALAAALAEGGGVAGASVAARGPRRRDHGDGKSPFEAPLSFPQQRVWFLQALEPDSLAYNFQAQMRFRGDFRPAFFLAAARHLVARHSVLRTGFPSRDGSPVQRIEPARPLADGVRLPVVDLAGLPAARREAEKERAMRRTYLRPYDLERPPLMYWVAFRVAAGDHAVLHAEHHLIHDGWGFNVLLEEFAELYTALSEGRPARLRELPVEFSDFAAWQHELVDSGELEPQLDYWERQLAGTPPLLELPTDHPRPPRQSFRGAAFRARIPAGLSARLRELGRRRGATIYQVLHAAYLVLLHRYTGQTDLAVGVGVANRRHASTERLLGMLVNTVVLRTDVSGEPTFEELLARVGRVAREAWPRQDVPLERVVERVRPERDAAYNPLFQTCFHFHDSPLGEVRLPGVELEPTVGLANGSSKFDLSVICILPREQKLGSGEGGDESVELLWEYSTDLFDHATARRQWEHYLNLLHAVADSPATTVDRLRLLSDDERLRVVEGWNRQAEIAGGGADEAPARLEELFAWQVEQTPDAVAVAWPAAGDGADGRWTYRRLADAADAVARRLVARGIGAGDRVGVCLRRTPRLAAAILGTLRAGAAYVPLDPSYPRPRLAFMLADSGAGAVLTDAASAPVLGDADVQRLLLDGEVDEATADVALPPFSAAPVDGLSHVIYTSGSTGTPKGVAIRHRAAAAMLAWARRTYSPEERAGVLFSTSACFDLSVFEMFLPWTTGGAVVLVRDALELAELPAGALEATPVTLVNSVPSATAELLRAGALPATAVTVNLAGEALPRELVERLYDLGHVEHVYNLYGPSEDTTYSTWERVPRGAGLPVTIGRPLPGTRAYVADRHLWPTPVGVPGELCLAGDGLAGGYLGRPARTAAAFVPDPFAAGGRGEAGRLYRTGDQARWRRDGRLDFLGRIDGQVKLRGFRVEVGEVATVLAGHPRVREAAVVARGEGGDGRLVAFFVATPPAADAPPPAAAELHAWVAGRLPDFMVPAAFVPLGALPLNANGKVDRRELERRPLDSAAADDGAGHVAPRNEIEELLADVWGELIGVAGVGVTDDFFVLGGHSLHATRMVHRLRDLLEVDLPVRSLYDTRTVERLARRVEEALLADLAEPAGA